MTLSRKKLPTPQFKLGSEWESDFGTKRAVMRSRGVCAPPFRLAIAKLAKAVHIVTSDW